MKKKESSGKKEPPAARKQQKIFGGNSLQVSENDGGVSSSLVGGIVEKGFSQNTPLAPSSVRRSTVLPFPVARHRSHGPHWAPKGSDLNDICDDDEDDGEDGKFIAAFANPVQRKQKKGLDFSRWRELIIDSPSGPPNMTNSKLLAQPQQLNKVSEATGIQEKINSHMGVENAVQLLRRSPSNDAKEQDANIEVMDPEVVKEQEQDISDMDIYGMPNNLGNDDRLSQEAKYATLAENCSPLKDVSQKRFAEEEKEILGGTEPGYVELSRKQTEADVNKHYMSEALITSNLGYNNLGNEQGATTLGSQIDAENRARLERMSADEIAEAQDELMKKMNPALLEMLKKRGQNKLKKQECTTPDIGTSGPVGNLQDEIFLTNKSTHSQSDISHKVKIPDSTQTGVDDNLMQKSNPSSKSWETWSKRVEAVRELRFSLEGNVIESDIVQVPKAGNISVSSGYSAGNVSERDFLRTEGDPAAAGYTIKEALALLRSVVPGQRALALHILASVLDKASCCIRQNLVGCTLKYANTNTCTDWEAIWAFILGPEPELALSLRMSLDDNHNSVVLACAKVIQSVLSCDINDSFFDISEKTATYQKDVYTAPVFRSRPKIEGGFLHGGFWKYNTKPSNLLPFDEDDVDDKPEGEHTIQDDIVVAGQDLAAGLVRMGIIARIRYLLETDPSTSLEECLISILIAIARHSPACVDAIMKCQRLVQTVVNRFTMKDQMEINPAKIKAVTLLKVLAQSKKTNCMQFIKNGTVQKMTWHLYRYTFSLDLWVKSGRENCKFSSYLLVEQLRLWKVCIQYGYCVSSFADLLPALCIWLDVPTFENLIVNNILDEFAAITKEAYLVLEALTRQLPNFYSQVDLEEIATEDKETWCWSHVGPIVDLALKWIALKSDPYLSRFFDWQNRNMNNSVLKDQQVKSLLWVISAVMHMISGLLARVIPEDTFSLPGGHVPWLPEFVPKIGLEIIKQGIFSFTGVSDKEYGKDPARGGSFLEYLCHLRYQSEHETAIASVVCLNGLVQVVVYVDKLIRLANIHTTPSQCFSSSSEDKILANGILKSCMVEMEIVLTTFMNLIASEGQCMQSIEMFGRGGPAPGVGAGWGASGGGFWSTAVLLAQMDANFLIHLLEIFPILCAKDPGNSEEMRFIMQRINCALHICLIVGPKDRVMMDKLLGYLLQVPVLKCLDLCIRKFLNLNKGFKLFEWRYKEEDYLLFSNNLTSHFKNRWLCEKKKSKVESTNRDVDHKTSIKSKFTLDTIHEDCDASNIDNQEHHLTSLVVEWVHQRLPLPSHWFLSSLSTINDSKTAELPSASDSLNCEQNATDLLEVAKGGLFFLLGIEAISAFLSSEFHSSVQGVPLSWKLHSLSVSLFVGMGVLEEKSRDLYETLQEVYGQLLKNSRFPQIGVMNSLEFLKFQSDIHESYSTFIEALVEQFAAVSYGDLVYGRQVSIYLHSCVEAPVRLAAWNSLSNVRALELLPPIEKCVAKVEGYLEPTEDNEKILEAYVKSWTTGALDKAVRRGSIAFTLVLHHLSTFIFGNFTGEKISLRNKLAKSILRDYSRKQQHEGMMMDLIGYNKLSTCQKLGEEVLKLQLCEIDKRFNVLKEACEGSSLEGNRKAPVLL